MKYSSPRDFIFIFRAKKNLKKSKSNFEQACFGWIVLINYKMVSDWIDRLHLQCCARYRIIAHQFLTPSSSFLFFRGFLQHSLLLALQSQHCKLQKLEPSVQIHALIMDNVVRTTCVPVIETIRVQIVPNVSCLFCLISSLLIFSSILTHSLLHFLLPHPNNRNMSLWKGTRWYSQGWSRLISNSW